MSLYVLAFETEAQCGIIFPGFQNEIPVLDTQERKRETERKRKEGGVEGIEGEKDGYSSRRGSSVKFNPRPDRDDDSERK